MRSAFQPGRDNCYLSRFALPARVILRRPGLCDGPHNIESRSRVTERIPSVFAIPRLSYYSRQLGLVALLIAELLYLTVTFDTRASTPYHRFGPA